MAQEAQRMMVSIPALEQAVRRFRGDNSPREFRNFRRELETYWETYPGFSEKQKVHQILLSVGLEVRDHMDLFPEETLQDTTKVLDRLEEQYGENRNLSQLALELHAIRQGQFESQTSYEQRLKRSFKFFAAAYRK